MGMQSLYRRDTAHQACTSFDAPGRLHTDFILFSSLFIKLLYYCSGAAVHNIARSLDRNLTIPILLNIKLPPR